MAFQSIWYYTSIPETIITEIEKDLSVNFDNSISESRLYNNGYDKSIRNSRNSWVPTHHWIGGFIWSYIERANRENFLYDIDYIDGNNMQYTFYGEGEYYNWHNDAGVGTLYKPHSTGNQDQRMLIDDNLITSIEKTRKLSFVLQLSNPEDYEGGNLQLIGEDGKTYFAPRTRGTIIIFDSRTQHRVLKVKKGLRKSLVGWVVGPRWR